MSYLHSPRLVFAGKFQADPSTINNDPQHFNSSVFRSSYELPGATNGWWNPSGSGAWRFRDCTVKQVVYRDGTTCDDPNIDPIVGAPINDSDIQVEGKLVDLDSEQQMVSQIWGFQVLLGQAGQGFRADFKVAPFADIWVRVPSGKPDSFFCAFYQSVLLNIQWGLIEGSRFFQELSANGSGPQQLSIRFNVDFFNDDRSSPEFTFGRVVGAIGLHDPSEPCHFIAGRALQPAPQSPLNKAYAVLDGSMLTLDMGNSIPAASVGGPSMDMGKLYAALIPSEGAPELLGEIPYNSSGWYEQTCGIVSFPLSSQQIEAAASTPLGIVQSGTNDVMLAESPDGVWLRADSFVFRLDPGESASTTFYATKFGRPLANETISLEYDPTLMQGQITQGPLPGPAPVGEPQSALTFDKRIITREDGTAELTLTASDPGNPRRYIDGQVYGVTYGPGDSAPAVGSVQNPSQILNALVFTGYQMPDEPDWMIDVQPIFQQYANLYPVMRPIVDLADYASVVSRQGGLSYVFSLPTSDPNYMPVTRDLSNAKREMLLKWLSGSPPLYMRLDSKEDLMVALQQAIELEHSTIPPYLYALYSIKPGTNVEVAELIRSIVIEEMFHMARVCNVLISIGGSPEISKPDFVPRYPGPLPGGLRGGLNVRLRRCSIQQIRDVFMSIEEPEVTSEDGSDQSNPYTIGWFYDEIKCALAELSQKGEISFGNADRQVTNMSDLKLIDSLEMALSAIDFIKEQGEGASPTDPDDADKELAHYYKFSEIVHGRRIVADAEGFSYSGERIPFDPEGIWPMMDDPDSALFQNGSRARILNDQFSERYQALLNGLHKSFNGEPSYINQAIGMMYSLSVIARQLVQTPSGLDDGTTAGPSFQLPYPL